VSLCPQRRLESGEPTPSNHDGAGAFKTRAGGTVIVYNHEIGSSLATSPLPVPHVDGLVYDPGSEAANRDPQPIKALGRYSHEAAAVDPHSGAIYLTEDAGNPNGLLYRWEPPQGYRPRKSGLRALGPTDGVLAAMRCAAGAGAHVDDLSRATEVDTTYDVTWTAVPDRDARTTSTRNQFAAGEITRGRKFEGAWWGPDENNRGGAYIVTSFAREESPVPHDGQVWFYDPRRSTMTLKLRFGVDADQDAPGDGPDNITVSPWGGLVLAEDGEGVQHLVGVTEGERRSNWPATSGATASSWHRCTRTTRRCCSRASRPRGSCPRSPGPGATSAEASALRRTRAGRPRPPTAPPGVPAGPPRRAGWPRRRGARPAGRRRAGRRSAPVPPRRAARPGSTPGCTTAVPPW
jgi:hypothetical protein